VKLESNVAGVLFPPSTEPQVALVCASTLSPVLE